MKRRQIGLFGLTLIVLLVGIIAFGAGTGSATDGSVDVAPSNLNGSGTSEDPYQIWNVYELQAMGDDLSAHYVLMDDIDATGTEEWNNGNGFEPIGDDYKVVFNGSFDGNDFTITNLTIDRSNEDYVALFGSAGSNATIANVSLNSVNVSGNEFVGGLVGHNWEGTVDSSHVTGNINGSVTVGGLVGRNAGGTVSSSEATGNVNGSITVGGLIGSNDVSTVSSSYSSGNVNGSRLIGGLVGWNNGGTLKSSYATGDVNGSKDVGGLAGYNTYGTVNASYAIGNVSGDNNVGGLVGYSKDIGMVKLSYATGNVNGSYDVGGLVGDMTGGTVSKSYATGDVDGSEDVGGLVGYNWATVNRTYATGNVNGSRWVGGLIGVTDGGNVSLSYATGKVTGGPYEVAGLIGYTTWDSTVTGSYWDIKTTGKSEGVEGSASPEIAGLTTAEMTGTDAETNMNSFDFQDVWQTQPENYPKLIWPINIFKYVGGTNPELIVSSYTASPNHVKVGDNVTVEATVKNTGEARGSMNVTFYADGEEVANEPVELDADNSTEVTFTIAFEEAGTHNVRVNGLNVTEIRVGDVGPGPVGHFENPPTDTDGDEVFEDVNGDSSFDVNDVTALWANRNDASVTDNAASFDINGDSEFDVNDVTALWNEYSS